VGVIRNVLDALSLGPTQRDLDEILDRRAAESREQTERVASGETRGRPTVDGRPQKGLVALILRKGCRKLEQRVPQP
jgi:hypothetical protein